MFGSKKKAAEAEEDRLFAEFGAWFEALGNARPEGTDALADDLLNLVGDPYRIFPAAGTVKADLLLATAHAWGRERAARLSRKAILESDPDARSRSDFWQSVSNRL